MEGYLRGVTDEKEEDVMMGKERGCPLAGAAGGLGHRVKSS